MTSYRIGFDRVDRGFQILYDNVHWMEVCCDDDKVTFANSNRDNVFLFVVHQLMQIAVVCASSNAKEPARARGATHAAIEWLRLRRFCCGLPFPMGAAE